MDVDTGERFPVDELRRLFLVCSLTAEQLGWVSEHGWGRDRVAAMRTSWRSSPAAR